MRFAYPPLRIGLAIAYPIAPAYSIYILFQSNKWTPTLFSSFVFQPRQKTKWVSLWVFISREKPYWPFRACETVRVFFIAIVNLIAFP